MANIQNQLKALNERIADIGRELGTDSAMYQRYEAIINKAVPAQFRGESKSGFIRLNTGASSQQAFSGGLSSVLDDLRGLKTKGEYKGEKKRQYSEEYGYNPSKDDLNEYIRKEDAVADAFNSGAFQIAYNEASERDKRAFRSKGSKSYAELYTMLEKIGAV